MCEFNPKNDSRFIDPCMVKYINFLREGIGLKTLGCCCGHGKYPKTVIIKVGSVNVELISGKIIPRKRRFYKKDKQGYYFIPEVIENDKPKKT